MMLVALAWLYVALLVAVAEATHPQGSVLGALFSFLLYGLLPLAILLYVMATPARRRRRRRAAAELAEREASVAQPDAGGQPPGEAVAPKREEA